MNRIIVSLLLLTLGALLVWAQSTSIGMGTVQTPDGTFLKVPPNVFVRFEGISPEWNVSDLGGYQPCEFNHQRGFTSLPCASSYALQGKRLVALPFCTSGQRVGTPVQCFCTTSMAGNSGKCK